MKINDFRISTRLGLSFGLILLIMVTLSLLSLNALSVAKSDMENVVNENNVKIELNSKLAEAIHIVVRVARGIILIKDPETKRHEYERIVKARENYDDARAKLEKMQMTEQEKANWKKIDAVRDLARPLNNQVITLAMESKNDEALKLLLEQAAPATQKWQDAISENIVFQQEDSRKDYEEVSSAYDHTRIELIAGNLLGIVLTMLLGWLMTRSVARPLAAAQTAVGRLSDGDLTVALQAEGKDETAQLVGALVQMKDNLVRSVSQVRQTAESVASASEQIAQGNHNLSQRTEEQASALEQTAASMEELGGTARLNADNVKQANQLALNASEVASHGGEVVSQVIDTMKGINEASKKIGDIINVIDGIAFQTNILALNAAVEAARAGEQGRGFAVVASEVRSLAQRSAEAAKEIKGLISTSVERVGEGTHLVDKAGTTMAQVVLAIKHVTDLMSEINVASNEQSANVTQVSTTVSQMDQVTQQNAALVEESAAAADGLRQQAHELVQAMAVFKIGQYETNKVIRQAQLSSRLMLPSNKPETSVRYLENKKSHHLSAAAQTRNSVVEKNSHADSSSKAEENWETF